MKFPKLRAYEQVKSYKIILKLIMKGEQALFNYYYFFGGQFEINFWINSRF